MRRFLIGLLLTSFALVCLPAQEVRFPGFFGDHMVLQRQAPIPIWGWAVPGEEVTVSLGEAGETVKADASGRWDVKLPAQEANHTGLKLSATAASGSKSINDVLIGEVWLCSGQSNMEWSVRQCANPNEEIAAANYPKTRQMKIKHITSGVPRDDVATSWSICSPETAASFTAAGYYMARELHKNLEVPIGLLNISWGGTRIDPWIPVEGWATNPALADIHAQVIQTLPGNPAYQKILQNHITGVDKWLTQAKSALANNQVVSPSPTFPKGLTPLTKASSPTTIYNAMLNPVVGYGMRGAVWYQGESNHTEGMLYFEKKKALLAGWRKLWGIGEFPFYFVQIAPYKYGNESPDILANFWEAQAACLQLPSTGMVVTSDIGNINDIHPKNKQEVGRRLSLLAMKHTYGKSELVASGPKFEKLSVEDGQLRLTFSNVAGGLKSRDGKPLTHFEIIGEQGGFVAADATIDGTDSILLRSAKVKKPAAMRFGWHKLAEPNLANGAGLPAYTFRAGEIPSYDFLELKVKESAEYELVYDLDLKQLGATINYTADRSTELQGQFDRVGYFIELRQSDGAYQWSWVSMKAFTKNVKHIGIPFAGSGIHFQQSIEDMNIVSSNGDSVDAKAGNIEFWSTNYRPDNGGKVAGASAGIWDFGDQPEGKHSAGYGSMQVHHTPAKQTVFSVNNWKSGAKADVGIGNSKGANPDWTFAGNAGSLQSGRLRVLVRKISK